MVKPQISNTEACTTCGRIFNRKSDLKRHLQIHSPDKEKQKFACPWPGCSHRTLQKSNLNTHLNVHLGLRPYECPAPDCQFKSADPGSLIRHRSRQHGHKFKGNSQSRTPAPTRSTTRRQRRSSPYTIPEDDSSSSCLPADDHVEEGARNTFAAYGTELIARREQVIDAPLPPSQDRTSLASGPEVLTASEPSVVEHSNLLMPEQGNPYTFGSVYPIVGDDLFGDFNAPFDDWFPPVGPFLPFPLVQPAVEAATMPTSTSLSPAQYDLNDFQIPVSFPSAVMPHTIDGVHMPAPSFTPSYEPQYSVDNSAVVTQASWIIPTYGVQPAPSGYNYDGYATCTASFEPQFNFSQPNSFAPLDMGMGASVYPQPQPQPRDVYPGAVVHVNQNYQSYPYMPNTGTTFGDASTSGDFGMQACYAW